LRIFHIINEQRSECDIRYLITVIEFTRDRILANFEGNQTFHLLPLFESVTLITKTQWVRIHWRKYDLNAFGEAT